MALAGQCRINEPILLINIGGNSTELIVMHGSEAVERKNVDLGVGTINTQFPTINETYSGIDLKELLGSVKKKLPVLKNLPSIVFLSGNELTYMRLAGYKLRKNNLFQDENHPSLIEVESFCERNKAIFRKIILQELEELMPDNPKWMHGARGHSAIVQAICEKYKIKTIIPSDGI